MSQVVENELQVGDLVRVIDADSLLHGLEGYIAKTDFGAPPNVYLFESDDKQHRCWFSVESLRKLRDSWVLEPPADHNADADKMVKSIEDPAKEPETIGCNHHVCELAKPTGVTCPPDSCDIDDGVRELPATDHIADANKMVPPAIPAGWRELFDGEALSKTDLYRDGGKWVPYGDFNPAGSTHPKYDKRIHYQHIRKIEQWPGHVQGVWVEEGLNATSINFEPKRPVVYIAGPMRGIPHFNFPAFDAAKAYLIGKGYDVLSPADFDRELDGFDPYKPEYETAEGCADFPKTMDFRRVVTRDLTAVTQCDAVALLPGWENSNGAVAEIAVAHWMGKPLIYSHSVDHTQGKAAFRVIQKSTTTLKQFASWLAAAHVDSIKEAIALTPPEQDPDCDILEVAASITRGDRQAVYGPPDQDFKKTADMWTGMFQYMLADGAKFEPRHVAMAMICIKLSRESHQRKRDNWIDIAGYARCGSLCSS